MTASEDLRDDLGRSRAELLAALDGITPQEFEGPVRELLWHAGLQEDWLRRAVAAAAAGRDPDAFVARPRPAIAQTVEYLIEWLSQVRRPLLALLSRLPVEQLDATVDLPPDGPVEGRLTVRELLARVVSLDRGHAEVVRVARGTPRAVER